MDALKKVRTCRIQRKWCNFSIRCSFHTKTGFNCMRNYNHRVTTKCRRYLLTYLLCKMNRCHLSQTALIYLCCVIICGLSNKDGGPSYTINRRCIYLPVCFLSGKAINQPLRSLMEFLQCSSFISLWQKVLTRFCCYPNLSDLEIRMDASQYRDG